MVRVIACVFVAGSLVICTGCGGGMKTGHAKPAGLIAYTHQTAAGADQIMVMRGDGSGARAMTRPAQDSLDPVWSPDGKRLAFLDHDQRLVIMNANGTGRRIVSRESGLSEDEIASWSPDGKQLAFDVTDPLAGERLFVVNADGTGKHALGRMGTDPVWSPDGRTILFADEGGELALIRSDGTDLRVLDYSGCINDPARWSPDGSRIAFVGAKDCWGNGARLNVMNADGTRVHVVADALGSYGAPVVVARRQDARLLPRLDDRRDRRPLHGRRARRRDASADEGRRRLRPFVAPLRDVWESCDSGDNHLVSPVRWQDDG